MTYLLATDRAPFAQARILCTDGEWHAPMHVGPNQWSPKLWKTLRGAEKAAAATGRRDVRVLDVATAEGMGA